MQSDGTINTAGLPQLLRQVASEHETGELSFNWSGLRTDLYFMFGRLYHAVSGEARGSEVVYALLHFPAELVYHFTTGYIPADASVEESLETILTSISTTHASVPFAKSAAAMKPPPAAVKSPAVPPTRPPEVPVEKQQQIPTTVAPSTARRPVSGGLVKAAVPSAGESGTSSRQPALLLYRSLSAILPRGTPAPVLAGPFDTLTTALLSEGFSGYAMSTEDGAETGLAFYLGQIWHAYRKADLGEYAEGARVLDHLRQVTEPISFTPFKLDNQVMYALSAQLQSPGSYSGLSVRIIRVRYLMESLAEGRHTGTVTFTNSDGARADVLFYNGRFTGSFGYNQPSLRNDADWIREWLENPDTLIDIRRAKQRPTPIDGTQSPLADKFEGEPLAAASGANEQLYATLGAADQAASQHHRPASPSLRDAELETQLSTTVTRLSKNWNDLVVDKRKKQDLKAIILTMTNLVNDTIDLYETVVTTPETDELLFKVLEQRPVHDEPYFSIFELVKRRLNIVLVLKAHSQAAARGKENEAFFFNETVQILLELIRTFLEQYTQQIKNGALQKRARDTSTAFINEVSHYLLHS